MNDLSDERMWLRHIAMRLRLALRYTRSRQTEAILKEVVTDAEARLETLGDQSLVRLPNPKPTPEAADWGGLNEIEVIFYFDVCELGFAEVEPEPLDVVEWLVDPVVLPDPEAAFMASKTDIPRGPIVITMGSPSGDFPWTTYDWATTLTSVNPSLSSVFLSFSAAPLFCVWLDGFWEAPELWALELVDDWANAGEISKATVAATIRCFIGSSS
jgi:hypothetical protein